MKYLYKESLEPLLFWIQGSLSQKQFVFLSSVIVGITSGMSVIVLKSFASLVLKTANNINASFHNKYLLIALPVIGILLTVAFIDIVLKGKFEKGTSTILYAIRKKSSNVPKEQTYSQSITSALTVGMGGSAGLESPIVIAGAAFGSNYSKIFNLNYKTKTLLLACGVAAGISAAFNAPIAGVLFATEVLLIEISIAAFIPLIIAAATGALVSTVILDDDILLSFKQQEVFHYQNVPFYITLGLLSGLITVYYSRMSSWVEHLFEHKANRYAKALLGSVILAGLIFIIPSLFGEGYESIKILSLPHPEQLLHQTLFSHFENKQWSLLCFVGIAMFLKIFATGLTLGSGGNGGNFAPSLFMGAYLGFLFSQFVNFTRFSHELPVSNFTIVGMAGMLSGIFHAPLTAIFLIGEITGGYGLMIPLMIVSSLSFAISKSLEKHSVELKVLAKMGHVYTGDKDKDLLSTLELSSLLETDYDLLDGAKPLSEEVHIISSSSKHIFPVVSRDGKLEGLIYLDNIRKLIFNRAVSEHMLISELMVQPLEIVNYGENMETVMLKFDRSNAWVLPVVEKGTYKGFISKSSILNTYRSTLISSSID